MGKIFYLGKRAFFSKNPQILGRGTLRRPKGGGPREKTFFLILLKKTGFREEETKKGGGQKPGKTKRGGPVTRGGAGLSFYLKLVNCLKLFSGLSNPFFFMANSNIFSFFRFFKKKKGGPFKFFGGGQITGFFSPFFPKPGFSLMGEKKKENFIV